MIGNQVPVATLLAGLIALAIAACATVPPAPPSPPSPMAECRNLCMGGRVASFSDGSYSCKCNPLAR
jgi:hypothetical protein